MIKNYKIFSESLLDKMTGPSLDDITKSYDLGEIDILKYLNVIKSSGNELSIVKVKDLLTKSYESGKINTLKFLEISRVFGNNLSNEEVKEVLTKSYESGEIDILDYLNTNRDFGNNLSNDEVKDLLTKSYESGKIKLSNFFLYCKFYKIKLSNNDFIEKLKSELISKKIGFQDFFNFLNEYDIKIPKDEVFNILYGRTFENIVDYFEYLMMDIEYISPTEFPGWKYIKWGKNNIILFTYNKDNKSVYLNHEILPVIRYVYKNNVEDLLEVIDNFIGKEINSKSLINNTYLNLGTFSMNWTY